jgi:tRNA pseudouridine55 synthase
MNFDGILLINKPSGWSSFDVVAKVRSVLSKAAGKKIKVGHTGTLDPLATGLMIIVVGSYCKRAHEFSKLDKTYEVTMRLGETSTTGDSEGEILIISDLKPEKASIKSAINYFIKTYNQIPPAFSAIKIDGQRAYKLAREGKKIEMQARQVTIYNAKLADYKYPLVQFTADVSSGTYIRSLVGDIGDKLQTGGYMSALNRRKIGDFTLGESINISEVTVDKIAII